MHSRKPQNLFYYAIASYLQTKLMSRFKIRIFFFKKRSALLLFLVLRKVTLTRENIKKTKVPILIFLNPDQYDFSVARIQRTKLKKVRNSTEILKTSRKAIVISDEPEINALIEHFY